MANHVQAPMWLTIGKPYIFSTTNWETLQMGRVHYKGGHHKVANPAEICHELTFTKTYLAIKSISFDKSFWKLALSMSMLPPFSALNYGWICLHQKQLWTNYFWKIWVCNGFLYCLMISLWTPEADFMREVHQSLAKPHWISTAV